MQQEVATARDELKKMIRERAHKKQSLFRTPSGMVESFFDILEISLKHRGIELAGRVVYEEIKDLDIQALGGPSHGIASIICRAAFLKEIGVFYIRDSMRKEGNIHAPKWIESRIRGGDRVAIVGDVVASGSVIMHAVEEVMQLGGEIAKIVVLVDLQEGNGVEKIKKFLQTNLLSVPISVIFTREEILA